MLVNDPELTASASQAERDPSFLSVIGKFHLRRNVRFHALDVTNEKSVRRLGRDLEKEFGGLDILVNNAGVLLDRGQSGLTVELESVRETMETNGYGPLRLCQTLVPLMRKRQSGKIVNVST